MKPMRILSVTSEIYPIVKTGASPMSVGALPIALKSYGIEMRTLVPGYLEVVKALQAAQELIRSPQFFGGPARLIGGSCDKLELFVLDAPQDRFAAAAKADAGRIAV